MTTAYVDGDIVCYRCATSSENDEEAIALFRIDDMMEKMMLDLQCEHYKCYLTGNNNFRRVLSADYKANRKDKARPKHWQACRDHLISKWYAEVIDKMEADDALGIAGTHNNDCVICTIDKDLLQVPGDHYNFVKELYTKVGERSAKLAFWTQMLVGDTSDNVRGIDGIGPVKAKKHLDQLKNDGEWFDCVRKLYANDGRFLLNLNLFWIQRNERKIWIHEHPSLTQMLPSELVQEVEQKFSEHFQLTSSPSGTTGLGGTCLSTTSTAPTDSKKSLSGSQDAKETVLTSTQQFNHDNQEVLI